MAIAFSVASSSFGIAAAQDPSPPVSAPAAATTPPGYANVAGTDLPEVTFHAPHIAGTADDLSLLGGAGVPVRLDYGGVLDIRAGTLTAHPQKLRYSAAGGVTIVATDTTLKASSVEVDASASTAAAFDAELSQYPYRISGTEILAKRVPQQAPNAPAGTPRKPDAMQVQVDDARFATAPPGASPFFEIRAKRIILYPDRNAGVARNCKLYLLGKRLLTIRVLKFNYGGPSGGRGQQSILPVIGYSQRYGTFLALDQYLGRTRAYVLLPTRNAVQARVTSTQHLIHGRPFEGDDTPPIDPTDYVALIRKYTSIKRPRLAPGDPLLFHSFLPGTDPIRLFAGRSRGGLDVTEEVSSHIATTGNQMNFLYVSRLPEVRFDGALPLTRVLPVPRGDEGVGRQTAGAETFRQYLRRPTIYLGADAALGQYYEQPTNIRHNRVQDDVSLYSSPLLAGSNTIVLPRVQYTDNHYSGDQDEYEYFQASLLVQHYFTDRAAIGAQYFISSTSGSSPFNFDVLDTTRELDGRAQIGNHRIVVAGLVKYDAVRNRVYDYQITLAPTIHGVVPQLSYDFRTQSTEFGFEIPGVTF